MYFKILHDTYYRHGVLHHAYLVEGDASRLIPEISRFLEETLSFTTIGNPDFIVESYDVFGIDDGKLLQGRAAQKPLGERKVFIVSCSGMTREAQNALLKLFEEPTQNTHFFLVCPQGDQLLGTLRSRMFILESGGTTTEKKEATIFLKASMSDRLATVKKLADGKDKQQVTRFLHGLEEEMTKQKHVPHEVLESILQAETYLHDRGASIKLLLEHVALSLPQKQ